MKVGAWTANSALIDIGKRPDQLMNASLLFWLPPDTPFGNMQLKLLKIVERFDVANQRILDAFRTWHGSMSDASVTSRGTALVLHRYALEDAVMHARRAVDELIALVWFLSEFDKSSTFPKYIEIDCIGRLLHSRDKTEAVLLLRQHREFLDSLNDVSNALKHSFVHSDASLLGTHEPVVYALSLQRNEIDAGAKLYALPAREFTEGVSAFYRDAMNWLRAFSQRHLPSPTPARP